MRVDALERVSFPCMTISINRVAIDNISTQGHEDLNWMSGNLEAQATNLFVFKVSFRQALQCKMWVQLNPLQRYRIMVLHIIIILYIHHACVHIVYIHMGVHIIFKVRGLDDNCVRSTWNFHPIVSRTLKYAVICYWNISIKFWCIFWIHNPKF